MTLAELRINRGLTVAELAEATGVPEHVIRYAEKSGARPRPDSALRLATFFDQRVTDIWPINGEGQAS